MATVLPDTNIEKAAKYNKGNPCITSINPPKCLSKQHSIIIFLRKVKFNNKLNQNMKSDVVYG